MDDTRRPEAGDREGRDAGPAGPGWGWAVAAALAIWGCYLALTPWATLWDRDEPRFAQAAVEMAASGRWLYATFNGGLRPDKPILIYWLMAPLVRWLGASELAVRFWAPAGIAATALLTHGIGRRLLSARAGLWAMGVLATSPLCLVVGQAATTDAVLLACITGAFLAFASWLAGGRDARSGHGLSSRDLSARPERSIAVAQTAGPGRGAHDGSRRRHLPGLSLALALAQLVKGPVGLAVPVLGAGTALLLARGRRTPPGEVRRYLAGAAVAVAVSVGIFCLWAVPANQATGGALARLGLGRHVVGRALAPMEGHGGSLLAGLPYYLVVVWIGFAPWTLFLPAAISAVSGGRVGGGAGRSLLAGWVAPTFVLFTLVATKLPHYLLPVWPALALAVGGTLEAWSRGGLAPRDHLWLRRGVWLFAPLLAVAVCGLGGFAWLLASGWRDGLRGLVLPLAALAAVLVAQGGLAVAFHLAGRMKQAALSCLAGGALFALVAGGLVLPALEPLKPAPRLARAVRAATPVATEVATFGFSEPSLIFYLGRWPVADLPTAEAAAAWLGTATPRVLVTTRQDLARLQPLQPLQIVAAASGFNLSKGRWVELVAVASTAEAPPGGELPLPASAGRPGPVWPR